MIVSSTVAFSKNLNSRIISARISLSSALRINLVVLGGVLIGLQALSEMINSNSAK